MSQLRRKVVKEVVTDLTANCSYNLMAYLIKKTNFITTIIETNIKLDVNARTRKNKEVMNKTY